MILVAATPFPAPSAKPTLGGSRARYCLEHDLQSVLDEYVFLPVQDNSAQDPVQLAKDVAETVEVALSTVGGLSVARPKPKRGASQRARWTPGHWACVTARQTKASVP